MRQNEALAFLNLGWTYVNSFSAQVLVFCAFDAERDINRGELAKDSSFSCRSRYQEGLWHMESPLEIDKQLFDATLVKLLETPPESRLKRRRKAAKTGRRKSRKQQS